MYFLVDGTTIDFNQVPRILKHSPSVHDTIIKEFERGISLGGNFRRSRLSLTLRCLSLEYHAREVFSYLR